MEQKCQPHSGQFIPPKMLLSGYEKLSILKRLCDIVIKTMSNVGAVNLLADAHDSITCIPIAR